MKGKYRDDYRGHAGYVSARGEIPSRGAHDYSVQSGPDKGDPTEGDGRQGKERRTAAKSELVPTS